MINHPYFLLHTTWTIQMTSLKCSKHTPAFWTKIHCMQFLVHHAHFHVVADIIGLTNSCIIIKFILSCIKIVYISRVFLFSSYFLTTSAENCLSERHEAQKLRLWLLAIYKFEGLQIHARIIISSCQFLIVVLTKWTGKLEQIFVNNHTLKISVRRNGFSCFLFQFLFPSQ